jgi:hypothetical protein
MITAGALDLRGRIAAACVFPFFLAVPLFAGDVDPTASIGMDPGSAFAAFGAPQEVYPFRGVEAWQDNVVFFYPDFSYLFWYENRVWQVIPHSRPSRVR